MTGQQAVAPPLLLFILINVLVQFAIYAVAAGKLIQVEFTAGGSAGRVLLLASALSLNSFLGAFLALFAAAMTFPMRRWPLLVKPIVAVFIALETIVVLTILIDNKVYTVLGIHLDSWVVSQALQNAGVGRELNLGIATCASIIGAGVLIAACEWLAHRACARVAAATTRPRMAVMGTSVALAALLVAGLTLLRHEVHKRDMVGDAVLGASTLHRLMDTGAGTALDMNGRYPEGLRDIPRLGRKKNILFVMVESLRGDAVNDALTPTIARYSTFHGCLASDRHYAGSHATEYGIFSALYGLDAHHFLPFQKLSPASHPLAMLKASGYRLVGASASGLRRWNNAAFVVDQIDDYREILKYSADENDRLMVGWASEFAAKRKPDDDPFFMFLFFNSTHHNYRYPPSFERFTPVLPANYNHFASTTELALSKDRIFNRYRNAVGYVDHLFGMLAGVFANLIDRDELVIVLTGDHGEEFFDHGLLGHGKPSFIDARTRVPLVLCLPGEKTGRVPISSHADIFPTLLDYLHPDTPIDPVRHFSGRSLLADQPRDKIVILSASGFPYKNGEIAAVQGTYKYLFKRRRGYLNEESLQRITNLNDVKVPHAGHDEIPLIVDHIQFRLHQFLK